MPKKRDFPPIHPGEVLAKEFLRPLGITQYRLAKDISVPQRRIGEIVAGSRSISADTALRLGHYFGMDPQFWLNLQSRFDLVKARATLGRRLRKEVRVHTPA
jgi:addiction module HigA family antidote